MGEKSSRNYGIDALRIVSMLGVVVLHILRHGGVLWESPTLADFSLCWLLETIALPAVNCFVIISGFVGYRDKKIYPNPKGLISLWFIVLFYSVAITVITKCLYPGDVGMKELVLSALPIGSTQYWFFSCYAALIVLSPLLNSLIAHADAKLLFYFVSSLLLVFSGYSTAAAMVDDPFILKEGYSVLWFVLLYLAGAVIKKTRMHERLSAAKGIWMLAISYFITWTVKVGCMLLSEKGGIGFADSFGNFFLSYCSPTMVIAAVGLLIVFSKFSFGKMQVNVIRFFSASAFSVYLIHDNRSIRQHLIIDKMTFVYDYPLWLTVLLIIGIAVSVFLLCIGIDKIRMLLFRLLRVDVFADWLSKKATKAAKRLEAKCSAVFSGSIKE